MKIALVSAAKLLGLSALLICNAAYAALDSEVRIDIEGLGEQVGITINDATKPSYISKATWLGDEQDYLTVVRFPASKDWANGFITFVPTNTGRLSIQLCTNSIKGAIVWGNFAKMTMEGGVLNNGDFSLMTGTSPEGWGIRMMKLPGLIDNPSRVPEEYVAKVHAANAVAPYAWAEVWHSSRLTQLVDVKAGKAITLRFKYRLGKIDPLNDE